MNKLIQIFRPKSDILQEAQIASSETENKASTYSILDNLIEGIQIIDFTWKVIYLNKSAELHNKRPNSEFLGKNYFDVWPGMEDNIVFQKIKSCMDKREPQVFENELTFYDGSIGYFDVSVQPIPEGVFIITSDISARKKSERENFEREGKFRHVFDASNVGKSITKINGEIEVNKAFSDMLGFSLDELKNYNWKDLTPQDEIDAVDAILKCLLSGEKSTVRFNKRYIRKDGTFIWADVNTTLVRDHYDKPLYFLTTIIDITKQKRTEEALQRNEHLFKLFVEHAPASIAMFDRQMRYIGASKRYQRDYGIQGIDFVGRSHYDVFPEIPDHWKEIHKRCLAGAVERNEKEAFYRADGKVDWVFWEIHPWYDNQEIGGLVLFSEVITHRVQAEEALRKSEDLFNKAFHGSPSPMIITRKSDGSNLEVNNSFIKLLELSREEIIGKINLNLLNDEHRLQIVKNFLEKESVHNFETSIKSKSGNEVFVMLSVENVELAGEECTITTFQDITDRKIYELKLKQKTEEIEAQNEEYLQLNEELIQINDELRKARDRAEESDRLKTAFLHNISHEIRTPMNAITGFINLLKNSEVSREKQVRYYNIIEQSCSQLLSIINDLIDIAAIEANQVKIYKSLVNINSIIDIIFEQFRIQAEKKDIELFYHIDLPDEKATIGTDETKLVQVITNLLNNAMKFTSKGNIKFGYNFKDTYLQFYVEDTGIGISTDMQEKIFNRFQQGETTKARKFGGSGLGLSISKGYVELLGGKIWTVSEEGKGAAFYFTIPYDTATKVSY